MGGRTQGLTGRRRNAKTNEPVLDGTVRKCSCGFSVRGSEEYVAGTVASFAGTCPSCGGRFRGKSAEVLPEDGPYGHPDATENNPMGWPDASLPDADELEAV